MFNENLKFTGQLQIDKYTDGVLVDSMVVKNLVVTAGKNWIASRMIGTSSAVMSHMAVGSGTTAAAVGDTTLQSEFAWGRQAFNVAASATGNTVTYSANFPAGSGNNGAMTEAGIFNNSTGGTMLCHTVFPVVNKADGDSINITWSVTAS